MKHGPQRRRLPAAGATLAVALAAAGCNLWPEDLGRIDLPYERMAAPRLERTSLQQRSRSRPRTVDEGLAAIAERPAPAEGDAPTAIRELERALQPLSVERLRLLVLRNNLDLEVALLEPEIARARVGAEIGRFDAVIGSHFRYRREDSPPLDGPLVRFTSDDPALDGEVVKLTEIEQRKELVDLGLGLSVPLPTGGAVEVEGLLSQKDVFAPRQFEQYVAATRFSFSQPLLRGAGTRANLAGIRMARVDQRRVEVRTRLAALRILAGAEKAYWRLYLARRMLDVRAEQYRLARENLELVRGRVEQGVTARVEVTRAELGVAQRLESLIVAETGWRLRQRELKTFLASDALPLSGEPMLEVATEPLLAGLDLDAERTVQQALAARLDLIELELAILKDGLDIERRENRVLPIANLDFSYGTFERRQGFGSAWSSQWDFEHDELAVGMSFELPFTNQRRRAQLEDAILTRARRLASRQARELMVRREVHDTVDIVAQNWLRIVAARQSVIVAGVNYDVERQQFELGLRTMREVLEALTALGEAQLAEVRAIVDYQIAQIDLAFATGTLLGYAGVELEPLDIEALRGR